MTGTGAMEMYNRRGFIAGGLALAASSAARTAAGAWPVDIVYSRLEVGAAKPFSLFHISDTHLSLADEGDGPRLAELAKKRSDAFGGDQLGALRDALAWARARRTDLIVHTGDLMDFQSGANAAAAKEAFGEMSFGCIGNHEWTADPLAHGARAPKTLPAAVSKAFPFDAEFDSHVAFGVNFVSMDDSHYRFTGRQAERFEAEVGKGLPIVLLVHVPIYTPGTFEAALNFWGVAAEMIGVPSAELARYRSDRHRKEQLPDATTAAFVERLRREPLLKAVLAGHEHFSVDDRFSETARQFVTGASFNRVARHLAIA